MATITLAINGRPCTVDADPETSLLTVLRENLDLIGTKYGCGEGQCGACTVLIDGRMQRSCVTRAGTVARNQITTIEGLAHGEQLHPVQAAFLEEGATAMRVLHARNDHVGGRATQSQSSPDARGDHRFFRRQHLSMRRLLSDHSRGAEGGERDGRIGSGEGSQAMSQTAVRRGLPRSPGRSSATNLRPPPLTTLISTVAIFSSF